MTDIARIGVKFDATDLERGIRALDLLASRGPAVEAAMARIEAGATRTGRTLATLGQGVNLGGISTASAGAAAGVDRLRLSAAAAAAQVNALGQGVNLNGVSSASASAAAGVDRLGQSAAAAAAQVNALGAATGAAQNGLQRTAQGAAGSAESMRSAATSANVLSNAFRSLAAGFGAVQLIGITDAYTKYTAQLKIATETTSAFAAANNEVQRIAKLTQGGLAPIGTLYARITAATREMGTAQADVAKITETVGLSLKVGGASAQEAASTMLQLSQAFGAGRLNGQEFAAVAEAAPGLLNILAESMGKTRGELKGMSEAGLLTTQAMSKAFTDEKVIAGLKKQAKEINTISGAFTVLRDEVMLFVGTSAQSSGAVKALTGGIESLARNLDVLAAIGLTVTAVKLANWMSAGIAQTYAQVAANRALLASNLATAQSEATATGAAAALAAARLAEVRAAALAAGGNATLAITLNGVIPAQTAATATAAAHATALGALTVAQRAASASSAIAAGATALLGSPLGIITTVLGLGATAWMLWGKSSEGASKQAAGAVEATTVEILANLDKQIEKAQRRLDLARQGNVEMAKAPGPEGDRAGEAQKEVNRLRALGSAITGADSIRLIEQQGIVDDLNRKTQALAATNAALAAIGSQTKAETWLAKYATDAEKMAAELKKARSEMTAGSKELAEVEKRITAQYAAKDKGAKTAAAAVKKEQSEYDKLVASIKTKIAQNDEEVKYGGKLNEAEKLRIKLQQEMEAGTRKATAAHQAETKALLEKLDVSEQARALYLAQKKFEEDRDKEAQAIAADIAKIGEKTQALEDEAAAYGKTAVELQALTIARLEDKAAMLTGFDASAAEAEIAAIREKILALTQQGQAQAELAGAKLAGTTDESLRNAQEMARLYQSEVSMAGLTAGQRKLISEQRKIALDYAKREAEIDRSGADEASKSAARANSANQQQIEMALAATQAQNEAWGSMWESVDKTAHDTFVNVAEEGMGAFKRIGKTLESAVLDMLYQMTVKKWIVSISGSLTGALAGGAAQAATGGGGASSALSAASTIGSLSSGVGLLGAGGLGLQAGFGALMSSGFAGIGASVTGGLAAIASGTGAGIAAGLGTIAGALGPIGLGLGAVYSIVKKFDTSGTYHSGGAGSYSAAGGASTGAAVLGQGLTFGVRAKDYSAQAEQSAVAISQAIVGMLDATASAFGKQAGYYAATAFADDSSKDGAWGSLAIKLGDKVLMDWKDSQASKWAPKEFADGDKGKEQYAAALALSVRDVLQATLSGVDWAQDIIGKLGDAPTLDALQSAVAYINQVNDAFVQMGKTLDGFAGMSDAAFAALMKASGGIEALASNAASYYENFYPEAERMDKVTASLTAELAKYGEALPKSKAAYRKLVEEQLAAGESGAELAAKLLLLNGSFAQVTDYSEQAAKEAITSLLDAVGIGAADMGKTFRDVLLGRTDAAEAGAALADSVTGGIYNAIAGGAAQQLTDLMMTSLITPVVQAAVAGTAISEAVSQSAIDSMVQQAQRAAAALGQIFSDPAFQAAIASVGAAITGVVSAAGAGIKPYSPTVTAANSTASDSYAREAAEPLKNAWESLIASIVQQTQDATRELSRLGMTGFEAALAAIRDKADDQVRSLQDAGYMRAERMRLEQIRPQIARGNQDINQWRAQGAAENAPYLAELQMAIGALELEFAGLSTTLAKLPPEVQAMVDAETALLNARNALTAQGTLEGLGREVAQLGISAVAKQFQDLDSKAADYVKGLVDLGQATDANTAGVTSWADAMREQIRSSAYDSLLSPDELRTRGTAKLATDFSALGSSVPASTAALRGMIDAARDLGNLTLADSLLELVPGFLALQAAVEGAGSAIDNSGQADKLLAQLGKEVGYLGLSDIEKEIAGIAERGNEYRKTLADLGQGTDANIKAVNSWQNAMMESALAAQAAADIAAAAQDVQTKFAARNGAGALKDRLQDAMGGKGTFAAQREGELWTALAKTADYEKQIDLASQLTDIVMARQQLEVQNAERLLDFGKSLRSYVDSLKIGELSPLTNAQKLAEAARQYQDTLGKAQGGDTTAQGNLQGIASSYLDLARTYYAGNEQFAGIFGSVTQALDALGSSSMTEAQQQLAVGTQSLSELQKLYGITSTAYSALDGQYETAVAQLAKMQDALVLQTDSLEQLKTLATTMAGLPAEIAVRMPVIDTSAADAKAEKAASDLLDELRRLREEVAQLRQESRQDAQMQAGVTAASADASAERIAQASAQAVRANTVQQGATLV